MVEVASLRRQHVCFLPYELLYSLNSYQRLSGNCILSERVRNIYSSDPLIILTPFHHQRTYLVSAPIIPYYYTQLIGDAKTPPTLLASASFSGMAVIGNIRYLAFKSVTFSS